MAIDRRLLLASGAAAALVGPAGARAGDDMRFIAAFKDAAGYGAALLDDDGRVRATHRLDGRGHGAAVARRARIAVLFARRPGRFALAIDVDGRRPPQAFAPPVGRAFNGHGFFSADDRLLYATENADQDAAGALGVYDAAAGFRRVDDRPAGGVGPHEAILLADGRTAAVAVGGIETHPDFPRRKLNLPTMAPALAFVDLASGDLRDVATPPADRRRLSIRHLAQAPNGVVWFGGQWEGDPSAPPPLIGRAAPGEGALAFAADSEAIARAFHGYVGSVAMSGDGRRVVATSPRGGRAAAFNAVSGRLLRTWGKPDVCGVAPHAADVLTTSGAGSLMRADGGRRDGDHAWDNHIYPIG